MNTSALELYRAALDWSLTAPRQGVSGPTEWRAGYLVAEREDYIELAVSYTTYGAEEPTFGTKRRRVEWAELRTLMATYRTARAALTAVVLELFEECGVEPPL